MKLPLPNSIKKLTILLWRCFKLLREQGSNVVPQIIQQLEKDMADNGIKYHYRPRKVALFHLA